MPRWQPEQGKIPYKAEYSLQELLQYDDEDFVESAYSAILRRPPDERGFQDSIHALRVGSVSKVEMLGSLRWSEEGLQRGVHVDGLLIPWTVQKWRRKRWIGPVIEWVYTLLRLPRLARAQALESARSVREIQRLGRLVNQVAETSSQRIDRVAQRTDELAPDIQKMEGALGSAMTKIGELGAVVPQITKQYEEVVGMQRNAWERLSLLEGASEDLLGRLAELKASADSALAVERENAAVMGAEMDPLYAAFEEVFRGGRELVQERVKPYLADIETAASAERARDLIIDIGCGRGEWLELVQQAGFLGRGIDNNEVFVQLCRSRDLDVIKGDAFDVLKSFSDASATAITSMHLVEHLPYESLIRLIDECHRLLKPGGVLILETPNPENITVGSYTFYMDPTHRNPIPPGVLLWLAKSRGFKESRVERLTKARDIEMPKPLPEDAVGATSLNMVIDYFRAPVDYAVIARKGA
jgi:O-antigen chain-terminating methyltransferase